MILQNKYGRKAQKEIYAENDCGSAVSLLAIYFLLRKKQADKEGKEKSLYLCE